MPDDDVMFGDDPLANGMVLALRLRRDFTVIDADRLLAVARRIYRQLNPDTDAADGLEVGGWRAEIVNNEPAPLSPGPRSDCLRGDVFELPSQSDPESAAER